MSFQNKTVIMLFIILSTVLAGCASSELSSNSEKNKEVLTIYTTIYPIEDFTEKIGKGYVQVESIIPPGADAHTFEPTQKQMVDMAEGDAFIYNGAGAEPFADSISQTLQNEKVSIVEASEGVQLLDHGHHHDDDGEEHAHEEEEHKEKHDEHHHGDMDPHIWLDPLRAIVLAENIKEELVALNPEAEGAFEANFEELKKDLQQLDTNFHETLEQVDHREIIVSHAAYGYWEEAYGIEQIAISGLSPSSEPSQKELESIIETAKQHDLHYILFEQNVTPKVATVIQDEIGAEALHIHNVSVRTDEDIENEEDYFSLMEHNLEVLELALTK
ncbi:metal ABC transporter solute-binding protein, Zn/Mn family [Pontibacillus litoralis]|uniref:Adhesin n=1 Tax=Pontibacillus litoralis JSM 072002 TaxID=1385512 RepID=A0A0A5G221_9BACI|nr:zinc ABC transporter substrate-binding protein [Pontibacillus litoralis]KGX85120.1 hypothetical protein N784_10055 [Pontibacillus litoralis JSM 072002]